MDRHFTLAQARALLPEIVEHLRVAVHLKQEHEGLEGELQSVTRRIAVMGGMVVNRQQLQSQRTRLDALVSRLREVIEEIHDTGCQVKDLDMGLIDFPSYYRGQEVLLCFKLGETDIAFWHGLEEGFRGRKPIDQDFLDHHKGDRLD